MNDSILQKMLVGWGMNIQSAQLLSFLFFILIIVSFALAVTWIIRRTVLPLFIRIIHKNNLHWDDPLVEHGFFHKLSWFVPLFIIYVFQDILLREDDVFSDFLSRFLLAGVILVATLSLSAFIKSVNDIYTKIHKVRSAAVRGYTDAARIVIYIVGTILLVSILADESPWGLLSFLGGLTAVTLLVFKDTLLGFVANIQLASTDMLRIGDWIEMETYGADGDVIDVSIHSVRVQNWDKTITTIPTYALVSNSFKNWRGMSESGGRRIKRSIYIDLNTIHFVSSDELEELKKIEILQSYLLPKQREIEEYNKRHEVEPDSPLNGRCQTNIGLYRAYVKEYLRRHPKVHSNMTFLVRQLAPGPKGLPLEIYVFSSDQIWANYENIQADIFDHLLAALPQFGLRLFQDPSGSDFQSFSEALSEKR